MKAREQGAQVRISFDHVSVEFPSSRGPLRVV